MSMTASIAISVFGSSEPVPGDALYEDAVRLGSLLAAAGYDVVTGGYGGVMEGASRGASTAAGRSVGVACAIFPERRPNPYLDEVIVAADLFARTRQLIEMAQGYVVLAGKSGTLAELSLLWALDRAGCLERRPVVLLGAPWREIVRTLSELGMLEASQMEITKVVGHPEEAVAALSAALRPGAA
jgi:uncharacterized protein (TIGR00730 family)